MASRFWVPGGDGNWGSTNNWSATSGGASGASVPGASDDVTFDGNSGSGTCTLNASGRSCLSFDSTNSTNNTLAGSQNLTVAGSCTFGALFNLTATSLLTISAAGTVTFNGKTWAGAMTFGGSGITITVADTVRVTGLLTLSVGIGATKTINGAGKIITAGGLTWSNVASGTVNCTLTGGLEVTGGTVTSGGNTRLNATLVVSASCTFTGTHNMSGFLTQTGGTITWSSTPTINVSGGSLTLTTMTDFPVALTVSNGQTLGFNGGIKWTSASVLTANGTSGSLCTIQSSTGGVQASQVLPAGMTVNLNYCNLTDIAADQALYTSRGTVSNCDNCKALNSYTIPFVPLFTPPRQRINMR